MTTTPPPPPGDAPARKECLCVIQERPVSPCVSCWHFSLGSWCDNCGQPFQEKSNAKYERIASEAVAGMVDPELRAVAYEVILRHMVKADRAKYYTTNRKSRKK